MPPPRVVHDIILGVPRIVESPAGHQIGHYAADDLGVIALVGKLLTQFPARVVATGQ